MPFFYAIPKAETEMLHPPWKGGMPDELITQMLLYISQ